VFIFVFGLGIQGAALATVICQLMALAYTMYFLSDKSRLLHFTRPLFQLDWHVAKQSLAIGVGPFLMNVAASMVALFINQQLRKYGGDLAIGAYGIINRLTMLFIMVCMGFNQGLQPIAGYNYGARQYKRVREVFSLTVKWAVLVTTAGFLVSELLPGPAVSAFTSDPELKRLSVHGLRVMNSAFALVGFGMVTGNFFQCLGMVRTSIFLSLSRQLIFLVPLVYFLPLFLKETGVWLSFPVSDLLSIVVSAIVLARLFKKFKRIEAGEDPSILGSNIH
jgi:Na+-driven multidrug efflux pump